MATRSDLLPARLKHLTCYLDDFRAENLACHENKISHLASREKFDEPSEMKVNFKPSFETTTSSIIKHLARQRNNDYIKATEGFLLTMIK
jgi:hypothetical protein